MRRKRPQVLGADLNRSELVGRVFAAAIAQSRTLLISAGWPMNAAIMFSRPRNFSYWLSHQTRVQTLRKRGRVRPVWGWGAMIWTSRAALVVTPRPDAWGRMSLLIIPLRHSSSAMMMISSGLWSIGFRVDLKISPVPPPVRLCPGCACARAPFQLHSKGFAGAASSLQ
jgi:hypothetical protein